MFEKKTLKRVGAFALTGALAVTLAACSSGGDSKDSGGTKLTGDPVKIMVTGPINSQTAAFPTSVDAAVIWGKAANVGDGIAGHPVEIITCDNKWDPNATADCARDAVSEGVVAVVGYAGGGEDQLISILGEADIPWLPGATTGAPVGYEAENSFPVSLGSFQAVARALLAKKYDCKSPALFLADLPSLQLNVDLAQRTLKQEGIPAAKLVQYPLTAADLAPYVANLKGADCVIDTGNPESITAKLGPALAQSGLTFKRLIFSPSLSDTIIAQAPDVWGGKTSLASYYTWPTKTNEWADYLKAVDKYASYDKKKFSYETSGAQGSWIATSVVADVAGKILDAGNELTAKSLLEALSKATEVDTGGVAPVLNFTKLSTVPNFPRLFNPSAGFASVDKEGKIVPEPSGYHSLLGPIEGKATTDKFFSPK